MKRLRLFVKGNVDVHDALHSCRIDNELRWNGINAAFREMSLAVSARLRHETWTRSDALLASDGAVPEAWAARDLALGPYPLDSQFSRVLFDHGCDAVILSIQPDVMSRLLRHRQSGALLYANGFAQWRPCDVTWAKSAFEGIGSLEVSRSMANWHRIVAALQQVRPVPILIFNMSAVTPGETVYGYDGLEETLSERIRRFNLGLIELSRRTGAAIVDVDRIVAEHGANALKRDAVHLDAPGYRLVALEVARILEAMGALDGIDER